MQVFKIQNTKSLPTKTTSPAIEDDKRNLDDLLLAIKLDIKSFMDSVIQHQEEVVADIGES